MQCTYVCIAKPTSTIFDHSWQLGEVAKEWRKENILQIFKKGKEYDPRNYRLISLTLVTPSLRNGGADNLGNRFQAQERQEGQEEQSAWLYQAVLMLDHLKKLL